LLETCLWSLNQWVAWSTCAGIGLWKKYFESCPKSFEVGVQKFFGGHKFWVGPKKFLVFKHFSSHAPTFRNILPTWHQPEANAQW
jgi:hypothetical protein